MPIMFTANHYKTIQCKYTRNILKEKFRWKYNFIQKTVVELSNLKLGPTKVYPSF